MRFNWNVELPLLAESGLLQRTMPTSAYKRGIEEDWQRMTSRSCAESAGVFIFITSNTDSNDRTNSGYILVMFNQCDICSHRVLISGHSQNKCIRVSGSWLQNVHRLLSRRFIIYINLLEVNILCKIRVWNH